MSDIALVTGDAPGASLDAPLRAALSARGMTGHPVGWEDASVDWSRFAGAVVRSTGTLPWDRERLLAAARRIGAATALWNPAEVLRWNSHRSYLLELEERGAPIVPTAWMAQGDQVDLGTLREARGWDAVVVSPADAGTLQGAWQIPAGRPGLEEGQHRLDALLAAGDALVQPDLTASGGDRRSVVVIDGEVSHVVRSAAGQTARSVADPESAALARWLVEATGVELLYARVDLVDDASRIPQVLQVDAVAPELHLALAPQAADALAAAIRGRIDG